MVLAAQESRYASSRDAVILADNWCHQLKHVSDCIHVLPETRMCPHVAMGCGTLCCPAGWRESLAAPSVKAQGHVPPLNPYIAGRLCSQSWCYTSSLHRSEGVCHEVMTAMCSTFCHSLGCNLLQLSETKTLQVC